MEQAYLEQYRHLYEQHWWWRLRERVVLDAIRRWHNPAAADFVLDIGCGDGLMFDKLEAFGQVEGVEPYGGPQAHGEHSAHIYAQPFDESFRSDRRYGLITMLDVLEHLPNPDTALQHAADLLSEDGVLVVTVPAFRTLWTSHDDLNHHLTRYTKGSLRRLMDEAGLAIVSARYLFHWTCAAKLLIRLREMIFRGPAALPRVPSRPINQLLFSLTQLEEQITRHIPMPFGSSLIVVARHRSAVEREVPEASVTAKLAVQKPR